MDQLLGAEAGIELIEASSDPHITPLQALSAGLADITIVENSNPFTSGVRTVLVEQDMLALHVRPDPGAPVSAALELGVVARLGDCDLEWCELRAGGYRGWAPKARLWGVAPREISD